MDCALDEPRESTEPLAFAQGGVLELDRGREDKQHHVAVDCALDEPRESTEPLAFAQTPNQ
ncbi:MAG TPA: hypothetical protein VF516_14090 [Kofleriaceae bacterium]